MKHDLPTASAMSPACSPAYGLIPVLDGGGAALDTGAHATKGVKA